MPVARSRLPPASGLKLAVLLELAHHPLQARPGGGAEAERLDQLVHTRGVCPRCRESSRARPCSATVRCAGRGPSLAAARHRRPWPAGSAASPPPLSPRPRFCRHPWRSCRSFWSFSLSPAYRPFGELGFQEFERAFERHLVGCEPFRQGGVDLVGGDVRAEAAVEELDRLPGCRVVAEFAPLGGSLARTRPALALLGAFGEESERSVESYIEDVVVRLELAALARPPR